MLGRPRPRRIRRDDAEAAARTWASHERVRRHHQAREETRGAKRGLAREGSEYLTDGRRSVLTRRRPSPRAKGVCAGGSTRRNTTDSEGKPAGFVAVYFVRRTGRRRRRFRARRTAREPRPKSDDTDDEQPLKLPPVPREESGRRRRREEEGPAARPQGEEDDPRGGRLSVCFRSFLNLSSRRWRRDVTPPRRHRCGQRVYASRVGAAAASRRRRSTQVRRGARRD